MRIKLVLSILGLCLVLAGVGIAQAQSAQRYDWAVSVEEGATFAVGLPANPSTGYSWRMAVAPEAPVAEFLDAEFVQKDCQQGMVGCGGIELWRFRALSPGTAVVSLEYLSPGRPATVAATARVLIVVYPQDD
ncbi:MAG: protease inhibitor I42 family protein [Desulfarculaceae bacterium]|jgi:inhibitor of cysteine peptidase